MFSVWPDLFAFELLGVALLRVSVAYLFLVTGIRLLRAARHAGEATHARHLFTVGYGATMFGVGALLLLGIFTQPVALVGAILLLFPAGTRGHGSCAHHLTFLLLAACIALILLGPGIPAIDLPI